MATAKNEDRLTLNQMLKALDKNLATDIEKKLKKLSKKKALEAPDDGPAAAQTRRAANYQSVVKDVSKWESIVETNRKAKNIKFPLNQEEDNLATSAEGLADFKPSNKLEEEVQNVINSSESALRDNKELTKAEEKYLKAISAEEAKERHQELQRMRVLLSSYASKMRRQKLIKSKSYRRLLKHERVKAHMKKVETDKDALMSEIEKLQKIRAQERATLKHKNTGKWAKHAKFRAKYDDNARKAMLEQIGLAEKRLQRPAIPDSDDSDEDDVTDDDETDISEVSEASDNDMEMNGATTINESANRLIVSNELIDGRIMSKSKRQDDDDVEMDDDNEASGDSDNEEDPQRQLMSEAFAGDDVVKEFKKEKARQSKEEQPQDTNLYLPGWGDWAGPGLKVSKKKKKKYLVKAKKIKRRDENLANVIISEQANETIKELQPQKLPRGFKSDDHFAKIMTKPTASSFADQMSHRESTLPRIETKMGAKIEPINKRVLNSDNKVKWT